MDFCKLIEFSDLVEFHHKIHASNTRSIKLLYKAWNLRWNFAKSENSILLCATESFSKTRETKCNNQGVIKYNTLKTQTKTQRICGQ